MISRRRVPLAVGIVVAVAVLVLGVFPTRSYLAQRDRIATEEDRVAVLRQENERLGARVETLGTDAEVERLAREQYGLVKPGEEAYAILPGPAEEPLEVAASPEAAAGNDADRGFWGDLGDAITFWN